MALQRTGQAAAERVHRELQCRLRFKCLNEMIFTSLAQPRSVLAAWHHDYNHYRCHLSLGNLTPAEMDTKSIGKPGGGPPTRLSLRTSMGINPAVGSTHRWRKVGAQTIML